VTMPPLPPDGDARRPAVAEARESTPLKYPPNDGGYYVVRPISKVMFWRVKNKPGQAAAEERTDRGT